MFRHPARLVAVLCLAFVAASPAQGGGSRAGKCGTGAYSYAGLGSDREVHGIAATLVAVKAPSVFDGHVSGWIGVGGAGRNGARGWLQVGLAAFGGKQTSELYYEVSTPGASTYYHRLDPDVRAGDPHRVSVLEMVGRPAWWRVWVDDRAVSPPLHLPGSHGTWYPQAVGENLAGLSGACNRYAFRFADVSLARANGGNWQPLEAVSTFGDANYRVVETSSTPRTFVVTSV